MISVISRYPIKTKVSGASLIAILGVALFAIVTSCGTDPADTSAPAAESLNPDTATLQQIIVRTRAAMGEITSYKTRGTFLIEGLTEDDGGLGDYFTAWKSPDRFMFRLEGHGHNSGELQVMEMRNIGSQHFVGNPDEDWQEVQRGTDSEDDQASPEHLQLLDMDSVELISNDEVTENGTRVYQLLITESRESTAETTMEVITTILIDVETFLFVSVTSDQMMTFTMHTRTNGVEEEVPSFAHSVYTSEYYDYNQPVEIEVPDEYRPARTIDAPAASPTPISLSLEEIIERTREAMGAVTSYQTSGTITTETNIINIPSVVRTGTYSTQWLNPDNFSAVEIIHPEGSKDEVLRKERRKIRRIWYAYQSDDGWRRQKSSQSLKFTDRSMREFLWLLDPKFSKISEISPDSTSSTGVPNYILRISSETEFSVRADGSNFRFDSKITISATIVINSETYLFESLTEQVQTVASMTDDVDGGIITEHWTIDETKTYNFFGYNETVDISVPRPVKKLG